MSSHMDKSTEIAVKVIIPVTLLFIIVVVMIVCWIRLCRIRMQRSMYHKVVHQLDEEEMAFKRTIENPTVMDDFDDVGIEELFTKDELEDFNFDSKDKSRLSMLETLRNSLVEGTVADGEEDENGADAVASRDEWGEDSEDLEEQNAGGHNSNNDTRMRL